MPTKKKTVLIVEDETVTARITSKTLQKFGYNILIADTGERAVETALKNNNINLILMDIDLGQGIDGTEAAAMILKKRDIPVVFLSSHTEPEIVEKTEKITSYGYVVKNSSNTVLDASIKMAFKLFDANEKTISAKEKLEATLNALPDLLFEVGLDGVCYDFHAPRTDLLYMPPEELAGKKIYGAIPDRIADVVMSAIREADEKGFSSGARYEINVPAGKRWFEISVARKDKSLNNPRFIVLSRDITSRKMAEDAHREIEEKHNAILKSAMDGFWVTDLLGHILEVNDAYCRMSGYSEEEMLSKSIKDIDCSKDIAELTAHIRKIKNMGEDRFNTRHRRKDGSVFDVEVCVQYRPGDEGSIVAFLKDITEQKSTEDAIRESEEKYRNLVDNISDLLYEIDSRGFITYLSPSVKKLLDYDFKEVAGKNFIEFIFPEDRPKIINRFSELKEGIETPMEYRFLKKSGEIIWVRTRTRPIYKDGVFSGASGLLIDITESKLAEEALKLSEEQFRNMYENHSAVMMLVDPETGMIADVNNSAAEFYGYSLTELCSMNINKINTLPEEQVAELRKNALFRKSNYFTAMHKLKNSDIRIVEVHSSPIVFKGKTTLFSIIHDITDRKMSENALKESEQKYRTIFENSPLGIFRSTPEGRFIEVNPRLALMLGYENPETVLEKIHSISEQVYVRSEDRKPIVDNQLKLKGITKHINRYKRADGSEFIAALYLNTIRNDEGDTLYLEGMVEDISERIRAEELILEREKQFFSLFYNSPAMTAISRISDNKLINVNRAFLDAMGYSDEEISGKTSEDMGILADRDEREIAFELFKQNGSLKAFEMNLKKKDGTIVKVLASSEMIKINDEPCLLTSSIDITDRISMEEDLKVTQERYITALNNSADILFEVDLAGKFTHFKDLSPEHFGYTEDDIINTNYRDYMDNINAEKVYQIFHNVFVTGKSVSAVEWEMIGSNKNKFTVEASVDLIRDKKGRPAGFRGVLRDISERKKVETSLRESEERFRIVANYTYDWEYWDDENLQILYVSPSCERVTGYKPEEFISDGALIKKIVHPDDSKLFNDHYEKIHSTEFLYFVEDIDFRIIRKDGSIVHLNHLCRPIFDENNKYRGRRISNRDITERKIAEDKIKSLLDEKNLILREVHHRIKNNMNVINGLLVLQADTLKDPFAVKALEDAGNRVQSMMVLYDKLYSSSDVQNVSVRDYLPSLVDEIIANFPNSESVTVEKKIDDFILHARKLQPIGIIVNELLTNIMKYAFTGRENGLIIIEAGIEESGSGSAGLKPAQTVKIIIQDNGNGMPETVDFENSTGFGLQLVRMLMKELAGTMQIKRDNGTKIILEFEA